MPSTKNSNGSAEVYSIKDGERTREHALLDDMVLREIKEADHGGYSVENGLLSPALLVPVPRNA